MGIAKRGEEIATEKLTFDFAGPGMRVSRAEQAGLRSEDEDSVMLWAAARTVARLRPEFSGSAESPQGRGLVAELVKLAGEAAAKVPDVDVINYTASATKCMIRIAIANRIPDAKATKAKDRRLYIAWQDALDYEEPDETVLTIGSLLWLKDLFDKALEDPEKGLDLRHSTWAYAVFDYCGALYERTVAALAIEDRPTMTKGDPA